MAKKGEILLRVWDQVTDDPITLDIFENISIATTFQFSNIQDWAKTHSSFSQSFRLPGSTKNNNFFGQAYDINVTIDTNNFNPKLKVQAWLEYETIPILKGYLQLKNVIVQKGQFAEYDVAIFGDVSNLATSIGDKKLQDYCTYLSSLNHEFKHDEIVDSWSGNLFGGKVVYPLIDYGQQLQYWNGVIVPGTTPMDDYGAPVPLNCFKPALRVKDLLQGIFEEEGYTYSSDFFDNDPTYGKLIIPFPGRASSVFEEGAQNEDDHEFISVVPQGTNPAFSSGYQQRAPVSGGWTTNAADGGLDIAGNAVTLTDAEGYTFQAYKVPYSSFYIFYYDITLGHLPSLGMLWNHDVHMRMVSCPDANFNSGNTSVIFTSPPLNMWVGQTQFQAAGAGNFALPLQEDHYVRVEIWHNEGNAGLGQFMNYISYANLLVNGFPSNGSFFFVKPIYSLSFGMQLDMCQLAPDLKAIDLLSSLQKMFNLVILPDPQDPNNLIIEPYNEWISSGDFVDWTDKLDLEKDIQIKPTTELQTAELLFTYKEDADVLNELVQNTTQRVYGEKKIDSTNNDFAKGEYKVEIEFSPTPCNAMIGSVNGVFLPKLFDQESQAIDFKPRILQYNGLVPAGGGNTWYLDDQGGGGAGVSTHTTYPNVSHFEDPIPAVDSLDINFGMETLLQPGVPSTMTLYKVYWERFIDEIYSSQAKIMIANFRLTSADIFKFQFNDKIFIKDSYYRVNKINGWTINDNETTQVELLKLPELTFGCFYTPAYSTVNGQLMFSDPSGATGLVGNQLCCEFHGYNWQLGGPGAGTYGCYYNNIIIVGPVDPVGPVGPVGPIAGPMPSIGPGSSVVGVGGGGDLNGFRKSQGGSPANAIPLNRTSHNVILSGSQKVDQNLRGSGNVISGSGIETNNASANCMISGERNKISVTDDRLKAENPSTANLMSANVSGINGEAQRKGEWALGGGKRFGRDYSEERNGRNNHGKILFLAEGVPALDQKLGKYKLKFLLQGDYDSQMYFDKDTAWILENKVVMSFKQGNFTSMIPEAFNDYNLVWRDQASDYQVKAQLGTNVFETSRGSWTIYYNPIANVGIEMWLIYNGKGEPPAFITASLTLTYTQIKPFKGTIVNPEIPKPPGEGEEPKKKK